MLRHRYQGACTDWPLGTLYTGARGEENTLRDASSLAVFLRLSVRRRLFIGGPRLLANGTVRGAQTSQARAFVIHLRASFHPPPYFFDSFSCLRVFHLPIPPRSEASVQQEKKKENKKKKV